MQLFLVKVNGSKYKVESDDPLVLFAALLTKFEDGPIFLYPDLPEEELIEDDEIVLYAPDQFSKDNTINCNFDKFCSEHKEEIIKTIGTIEEV